LSSVEISTACILGKIASGLAVPVFKIDVAGVARPEMMMLPKPGGSGGVGVEPESVGVVGLEDPPPPQAVSNAVIATPKTAAAHSCLEARQNV
jgi:hypothetical protein